MGRKRKQSTAEDALNLLSDLTDLFWQTGESLFLRKIFPGVLLEKSAKTTRPLMPPAARIRPAEPVQTQQGV